MFLTIYNHEYGNTVRAFATLDLANQWKDQIGEDYWTGMFLSTENKPKVGVGDAYFLLMTDYSGYPESFEVIENLEVETSV